MSFRFILDFVPRTLSSWSSTLSRDMACAGARIGKPRAQYFTITNVIRNTSLLCARKAQSPQYSFILKKKKIYGAIFSPRPVTYTRVYQNGFYTYNISRQLNASKTNIPRTCITTTRIIAAAAAVNIILQRRNTLAFYYRLLHMLTPRNMYERDM